LAQRSEHLIAKAGLNQRGFDRGEGEHGAAQVGIGLSDKIGPFVGRGQFRQGEGRTVRIVSVAHGGIPMRMLVSESPYATGYKLHKTIIFHELRQGS
jgi:hypothetical protein